MDIIESLTEFIDKARRSRKYPSNTATNFRTPLRLIAGILNEEEKNSLALIKDNLEKIFNELYEKNKTLSASSIQIYKSRIRNLISDYENYGSDSTKMANWNRETIQRKKTEKKTTSLTPEQGQDELDSEKFEFPLRENAKAVLFLPKDFNSNDKAKLLKYLNVYLDEEESHNGKVQQPDKLPAGKIS